MRYLASVPRVVVALTSALAAAVLLLTVAGPVVWKNLQRTARQSDPAGEYFPLAPGNRWTYTSGRGRLVIQVLRVDPSEAGVVVTVEELDRGVRTIRTYRREGPGLFLVRSESRGQVEDYAREPQPVLLLPPEPGQSWTWRGNVGSRRYHYVATVQQSEPVETPAGRFPTALPVRVAVIDAIEPDKPLVHRQWLVPGIGAVRMDYQLKEGGVLTYALESYQVH